MNSFEADRISSIFAAHRDGTPMKQEDSIVVQNFTEVAFTETFGFVRFTEDGAHYAVEIPDFLWRKLSEHPAFQTAADHPLADVIINQTTHATIDLTQVSGGVSVRDFTTLGRQSLLYIITTLLLQTLDEEPSLIVNESFTPLRALMVSTSIPGVGLSYTTGSRTAQVLKLALRNLDYVSNPESTMLCPLIDPLDVAPSDATLETVFSGVNGIFGSYLNDPERSVGYEPVDFTNGTFRAELIRLCKQVYVKIQSGNTLQDVHEVNDLLSLCNIGVEFQSGVSVRDVLTLTTQHMEQFVRVVLTALGKDKALWFVRGDVDGSVNRLKHLITDGIPKQPDGDDGASTALLCHVAGAIGGFIAGRRSAAGQKENAKIEEDIWNSLRTANH